MPTDSHWGRWVLNGNHLIYQPDNGSPDPGYELDTSLLKTREQIEEWLEHLREKAWVQPEDLASLSDACSTVMNARIEKMKASLVDESEFTVPKAMPWHIYQRLVGAEWTKFLTESNPGDESLFQDFLERYPTLLPGPYGTPWGRYHGPLYNAVFAQPELPGFRAKRPDFLLFEQDSGTVYAVLIEIEAPAKPWCTRAGSPSSALTKAIDQLRDWKAWFADPINVLAFRKLYRLDEEIEVRRLVQHYVLVYGRREDANQMESFVRKRHDLAGTDEFFMTYDRLEPNGSAELTVKLDRSGPDTNLRVITILPTVTLNKDAAIWLSSLEGGEEAIRSSTMISDDRKEFLLERLRFASTHTRRRANSYGWTRGILDRRSWNG
jgi:hypothetical protein